MGMGVQGQEPTNVLPLILIITACIHSTMGGICGFVHHEGGGGYLHSSQHGERYLPWMGEGVPTFDGGGVPTLDGEGYLPWIGEGCLPWMERGYLLWMGEGYLPWMERGYLPWTEEGVPTLDWKGYLPYDLFHWYVFLWYFSSRYEDIRENSEILLTQRY